MSLTMPLILGVALPLIVSAAALLVAWRLWRADAALWGGRWGAALALGGGFFAGYVGILRFPRFPPAEASEYLAYFALAALILGLIESGRRTPWWVRWPLRAALCIPLVLVMTSASREWDWTPVQSASWVVGLTLAILIAWASAESQATRYAGASSPLILLVVTAGSSAALLLTFSALLAQLALALAMTLFVSALAAWRRPSLSLSGGGVCVAVVLLAGLLMNGYFYSELPGFAALALFAAPAFGWVVHVAGVGFAVGRRARGRRHEDRDAGGRRVGTPEHEDRDAPSPRSTCIRVTAVLAAVIVTLILCWLQNGVDDEYAGY